MENNIITLLVSSITGVVTFFVGQRKAKKEIEGMSITNIERSIGVYQLLIDDLKGKISELLEKVAELEVKVEELKAENKELHELLRKKS